MRFKEFVDLDYLDEILVFETDQDCLLLQEGKWVRGRFGKNIRIDRPTHGAGQTHAHIYGRKGEDIGIVNFDGTGSHGSSCKLHSADADALRTYGFDIPKSGIVEWVLLDTKTQKLFEGFFF